MDEEEGIGSRAWGAFLPVLCNTEGITSTYGSNHTLQKLSDIDIDNESWLPEDVKGFLEMNRQNTKHGAARLKIINTHFSGEAIDVSCFVEMEVSLLPQATTWMAKDDAGADIMYQFVRMIPGLFERSAVPIKEHH